MAAASTLMQQNRQNGWAVSDFTPILVGRKPDETKNGNHSSQRPPGGNRNCANTRPQSVRAMTLSRLVAVAASCLAAFVPPHAGAPPGGLPVVYISTPDGGAIASRQWRQGATVRVRGADGAVDGERPAAVRAFGNSSFAKPKKPLALRFDTAVSLLGLGANEKWFLVSNFMDHSLVRNALALTAANMTSLSWTPRWRLVNVVENGRYVGVYTLGEEIRVGAGRVDTDPDTGFLVELDSYAADEARFETPRRRLPVNVRHPGDPSAPRLASIRAVFAQAEDALYDGCLAPALDSLLDLASFADYLIVYELCQNAEPNGPRSCYMHLGRDGRLRAGPAWDFDLAFVDVGLDSGGDIRPSRLALPGVRPLTVDSLYNGGALWYGRLMADAGFRKRLAERWAELRPSFAGLVDSLDAWRPVVEPSALADQRMWGALDPARFDNTPGFAESFAALRSTLCRRLEALDRIFGDSE